MSTVSIITVSFNNANTIEKTIQSVAGQSFKNIEYIVIDGKSTDGTLEILKSNNNTIDHLVHEPDKGIYHAMNKGLALATGEYTLFLNADDELANDNTIEKMVDCLEDNNLDAVFAGVKIFKGSKLYRVYSSSSFKRWMFVFGHQPPHPGLLCKTQLLKDLNGFDEGYRIAGDFDLMVRLFARAKFKWNTVSVFAVKMQHGGASSGSLQKKKLMNQEVKRSLKANGKTALSPLIWAKYLFKIFQLRF